MNTSSAQQATGNAPWDPENIRALLISEHHTDSSLNKLASYLPALKEIGVNAIILEVNYHFEFKSYLTIRHPAHIISRHAASEFAKKAHNIGITIIPLFQVLGHQSKGLENSPLLIQHPDFDTTPGAFPFNAGLVSREWDPLNDDINTIVFNLIEEIIEAFQAPAIHIGMAEIFLLGHPRSPSTRYKNPAVLFAYVVNVYRNFLIDTMQKGMLIWGDRLIDGRKLGLGPWETSLNGTWDAIDLIPRDVIVCPWHYKPFPAYPSIDQLASRDFRVLPMSWNDFDAIHELIHYCHSLNNPIFRGFIFSAWNVPVEDIPHFPPLLKGIQILNQLGGQTSVEELN